MTKSGATTIEDTTNVWCGLSLCEIRGAVGAPTVTAINQFAIVRDGVASYIVRDHLMSVREVTDSDGLLQARYDFGPWGERTLTQGNDITPFGFTGQSSSRANIWNMTYRDYDAATARWLNEDPIGLGGGINLYGYVGGNPVSRVDPSGLVSVSMAGPQRITTTSQGIGGNCGVYEPNALFTGGCACLPGGGYRASLIVTFHSQIYVATNIRTPPDTIYGHEFTFHHQRAQGIVNEAIQEGGRLEDRVFSSYKECNTAVADWAARYNRLVNNYPFSIRHLLDTFKCDLRPPNAA